MTIRIADPARDAAACAEVYAPYITGSAVSFEELPPRSDVMRERMDSVLESLPWLVAQDASGTVIGYAYAGRHAERAAYRWSVDVSIYLAPGATGQGIGRRLYAELFAVLRQLGYRTACAGITLPNAASVGIHKAMGFEPVGVYPRIGWKNGAWHDVGWWQLDLAPDAKDPPAELLPFAR